ncbi:MAG: hypothetical protein BYD32DRAFT_434773 [Podila humilis]|nr:MAG: hypothetical protein BYD32DRAFT_434773 [Podila humilis]
MRRSTRSNPLPPAVLAPTRKRPRHSATDHDGQAASSSTTPTTATTALVTTTVATPVTTTTTPVTTTITAPATTKTTPVIRTTTASSTTTAAPVTATSTASTASATPSTTAATAATSTTITTRAGPPTKRSWPQPSVSTSPPTTTGSDADSEGHDLDEQPNPHSRLDKGKVPARSVKSSPDPDAVPYSDHLDSADQQDRDVEELDIFGNLLFPPPGRRAATPAATVPEQITIVINLRIGEPLTHTRPRKWLPGPMAIHYSWNDDDYDVICHKIRRKVAAIPENVEWECISHPYLQPHNTATANNYIRMDSGNCNGVLRAAWLKEFRRTKRQDSLCHVYVYLKDNQVAVIAPTAATGLSSIGSISAAAAVRPRTQPAVPAFRRATQGRIMQQVARIGEQSDLQNLGAIETSHLARTLARRPPSNAPIVVPRTDTFRQMRHLDEGAATLRQHQTQATEEQQQVFKTLSVRLVGMTGVSFQVELSVSEVRAFLELPDMSLNGVANFREAEINPPQEDIEDEDHAESEHEA